MFAINHAAAALLFKKNTENRISFFWVLLAVQFVEFLWVLFNFLGIEKTTTEDKVKFVGDIHLSYIPYSHSVLSSLIIATVAILIFRLWKNSWKLGLWIGLAFFSHIILDIITHAKDIPLGFNNSEFIGLGHYSSLPIAGFILETGFGLFCWWYYRGSKTLFWIILVFNLFNVTMFLPSVKGPEWYMAGKPMLIVTVILAQIIITLFLVGKFSKKRKPFFA
ncbi:MAG TPA: hypothetical protein PKC72_06395 [Chitinophagaceae bacterium]|nr:hypothetical protein [Chitinophagaceae bacterium]